MIRRICLGAGVLAAVLIGAGTASAQSFGIGPRFSFVRGNLASGTPATRLIGGTVRLVTSKHTVLEGSIDYRAFFNEAGTQRTKETPMQGSLLLFIARGAFSPYLGGGIGLYTQTRDTLNASGLVTASETEKKLGWHLGAGAEFIIAKHVGFFVDYRFRFVKFGEPTGDSQQIGIPGDGVFPILQNVKISHEGSMWTSGLTFYF